MQEFASAALNHTLLERKQLLQSAFNYYGMPSIQSPCGVHALHHVHHFP